MTETQTRQKQGRITVKEDKFLLLKQAAKEEGRTMADIAEEALDKYFQDKNREN